MAGFFGLFDYSKPGPGVSKDEPPKLRLVLFFNIFFRKFWNLLKLNLLFTITNILAIPVALILTNFFIPGTLTKEPILELQLRFIIAFVFMAIPIITTGPFQAGFTYVLRNYAREEHSFILSDFREHTRKNAKQALLVMLIDIVVMFLAAYSLYFYSNLKTGDILSSIATGLIIVVLLIFTMMHFYIYQMMVTFKLTIKQLYKNALIFTFIKLPMNVLILILVLLTIFAAFYISIIGFLLYVFILQSFIALMINFYVYPRIKKYMMVDGKEYPDEQWYMEKEKYDEEEEEEDKDDDYDEESEKKAGEDSK